MNRNGSGAEKQDSPSKEFMLAQYGALSDSFWRNEEQGERRVNFLITMVTAVIGGLATVAELSNVDPEDLLLPAVIATTALLLLGLATWRRMLARNRATDEYKRAMEIVRDWFEASDPELKTYRPFPRLLLSLQDYADFANELEEKPGPGRLPAGFEEKFKPDRVRLGTDPRRRTLRDGRRWLVTGKGQDGRTRKHLLLRRQDKLAVYQPRRSNWGGLAETVAALNSILLGAWLALLTLFVARLGLALVIGLLGLVAALIGQYLWMTRTYERYNLHLPDTGDRSPLHSGGAPEEREITLLIASAKPERLVASLAALRTISDYRIVPHEPKALRDIYFDTEERVLESRHIALRLRQEGDIWLITLKGASQEAEWGGEKRSELEARWSRPALEQVLQGLDAQDIHLAQTLSGTLDQSPPEVLESLGFEVIQDREAVRQIRTVHSAQHGSPVLAELDIDTVWYRVAGRSIRHHELEIEAKTEAGVGIIQPMVDALTTKYGDALRVWKHPKLVTGFALEELLAQGALEGLLDGTAGLKPAAYERIDEHRSKQG